MGVGRVGVCCVAGEDPGAGRSRNLGALRTEQAPRIAGLGWGRNWAADLSVHGKQLEEAERTASGGPACHPGCPRPSRSGTCVPSVSSYLAVGSWLVDFRVPGGRWRRRRREKRERFHPFRVGEEQMKSSVSRPRGESPQDSPDLTLPSAQCHGATWNKAEFRLYGAKAEGKEKPPPQRPRSWWPQTSISDIYSGDSQRTTWLNSQEPW